MYLKEKKQRALLTAIYSGSFNNGPDAKRFYHSSFDRVQHTPVRPYIRVCVCLCGEMAVKRKIFVSDIYVV